MVHVWCIVRCMYGACMVHFDDFVWCKSFAVYKTPLCKFGELVMAYEPKSSNNTSVPRCFYALYLYPNENGSGHVCCVQLKVENQKIHSEMCSSTDDAAGYY